jgi:hypothetical protein
MSSGQISVQIRPRLEGHLNAVANRFLVLRKAVKLTFFSPGFLDFSGLLAAGKGRGLSDGEHPSCFTVENVAGQERMQKRRSDERRGRTFFTLWIAQILESDQGRFWAPQSTELSWP